MQRLGQCYFTQLRSKKNAFDVSAEDHIGSFCISGKMHRYLSLYTFRFVGKRQKGCKHLAVGEITDLETQQLFYPLVYTGWNNV